MAKTQAEKDAATKAKTAQKEAEAKAKAAQKETEAKVKAAEAMQAENEAKQKAEQKAKDEAAAKVDDAAKEAAEDETKRPLSAEERVELGNLEAQANQGTLQPAPSEMLKLGRLRQRAKLA